MQPTVQLCMSRLAMWEISTEIRIIPIRILTTQVGANIRIFHGTTKVELMQVVRIGSKTRMHRQIFKLICLGILSPKAMPQCPVAIQWKLQCKSLSLQLRPCWQIAQALQVRPQGNLPSNTEVTKSNGKEQCSALTLRSGKEINKDDKFGGIPIEDPTPSDELKESEDVIDSPIEEDKGEKLDNEKTEEQHAKATTSAVPKPAREEIRPPPPFPQRLKKHKEDLQFQKFVSMLDQFHINIPFLEAIEKVPSYAKFLKDIVTKKRKAESYETVVVASEYCARTVELPMKKKDPGSFIIPCSIGNNFMGNALCDLGSSVNLMPKVVFKKLGIGIEKLTTVILQLADRSHVRPEGRVEDVIV
ncbi:hypothetical protein V6N11_076823 [Hibiscus sabdariffa]|uniref:Aspartic peptidase DDI1-type domain-containing protein n=1 Tax=Hibiscus sabdariffa TaxID=183260 RepID=A0ABR2TB96_9ROSI